MSPNGTLLYLNIAFSGIMAISATIGPVQVSDRPCFTFMMFAFYICSLLAFVANKSIELCRQFDEAPAAKIEETR